MGRKQSDQLSMRELDTYEFIVAYKRKYQGNSPAIRDICNNFNPPLSTSVGHYYLQKLIKHGLIEIADDGSGKRSHIIISGGSFRYERPKSLDTLDPRQMKLI